MSRNWFIRTHHGRVGPVSLRRLIRYAATARIISRTAVSHDGKTWIKASELPELHFHSVDECRWQVESDDETTEQDVDAPLSLRQLQRLARLGRLLPTHRVKAIGQDWMKAKRIFALKFTDPSIATADTKPEMAYHDADEQAIENVLLQLETGEDTDTLSERDRGETRRDEFVARFGVIAHRHDGLVPTPASDASPISVLQFEPRPGIDISGQRPFTTLVTDGMSDHLMSLPEGLNSPRVELMMYIDADETLAARGLYSRMLSFLADVPRLSGRAIGYGSVIGNGTPPRPIFADSQLDAFVFLVPPIESDFQIQQTLRLGEHPVQLLWVMPITRAEREIIEGQGIAAFCSLCDRGGASCLLQPTRPCYASGFTATTPQRRIGHRISVT
ncbi:suppressor of fused domain protein [Stieleria varia]|uniref:Suppressor of fused protein (SUFU) n=1 Tax=Stieleria varia TaxID=2528005 RepID=A0A5C6BCL2_9BACT|nr:suppressor of fused domain protein [Stieleria varia]TWU08214.1 Suppressor of fused protein (SUFU) [Stieleria varia]